MEHHMKHKVRDALILFFHFSGASYLYRSIVRRNSPLVRVLVFHDVADSQWFKDVLYMLTKRYHLLTPEAFHARDFHKEKINILLTFDDGYASWTEVCAPILATYKTKGLFFINSGLLNGKDDAASAMFVRNNLHLKKPHRRLTWEGARFLVSLGHTIGGHTLNHSNVATLTKKACMQEIVADKKEIESQLCVSLTDFAYPFGRKKHRSNEAATIAYEAGYTHLFAADPSFYTKTQKQDIPRMCIEREQSSKSLIFWIEGAYDIFTWLFGDNIQSKLG
jgi:peptidoglycan/xylan/chitin deacetylase (PgdA/CDA1 family)